MIMKVACNKSNPPLGGLLALELYRKTVKNVEVAWDFEGSVTLPNSSKRLYYGTSNDLIRILENAFNKSATPLERLTMNHWLSFSLILDDEIPKSVEYLDKVLGPQTYLVGESLSASDLAVFSVLYVSGRFKELVEKNPPKNILRWMKLIQAQEPITKVLKGIPTEVMEILTKASSRRTPIKDADSKQEGKFVELPHAEMGKVVVRFPPEASGYLHIGHAKAALLNQYYQKAFEGKLIMRFDDTNPAKENADFEKVILEDVEMLEIKPDMFTHTSQYFDMMLDFCEKLIKEGKAFVDDTPAEQMKSEREQKVESKNRNNSVEKNLQLWEEMKKGSDIGIKNCVRAKIDMESTNGCLRDPTIYRCKPEEHPRTGNKYKVYPTYDFACPIVDSVEGVTHVLRTMEYHDRDPQFYWFIDALGLRKPYIWEYSRLSMTNTVLSKRKLTWFVEQKLVDGWDDPRMPTVRGVLRRGMTVEGLRQFITAQGSSRSVVFMEWDKIWAINKKVIDPVAPRYTVLESKPVPVYIEAFEEDKVLTVPLHPKNPAVGSKAVWVSCNLVIDYDDAVQLKEGENVTFINLGNILIDKIHKSRTGNIVRIEATPNLENKDYKKTLKITWLADVLQKPMMPVHCVYFDHIISKPLLGKDEDFKQYIGHPTRWEVPMLGEPELAKVRKGDIIQLQRRGFFRVDVEPLPNSPYSYMARPLILFHIPDGSTKEPPGHPKFAKERTRSVIDEKTLSRNITRQGEVVRRLKADKADKAKIDAAVKELLMYKTQYKNIFNKEWEPPKITLSQSNVAPEKPDPEPASATGELTRKEILARLKRGIDEQTDLVARLRDSFASKARIDEALQVLFDLKIKYNSEAEDKAAERAEFEKEVWDVLNQIKEQGDQVRKLKAEKADKLTIDCAVKYLVGLKASFKAKTNIDWTPEVSASMIEEFKNSPKPPAVATAAAANMNNAKGEAIAADIVRQGDVVRDLKTKKADKAIIDAEVKKLLELKAQYQAETGTAYAPPGQAKDAKPKDAKPKEKKDKPKDAKKDAKAKEPSPKPAKEEPSSGVKKITRLGLEACKETDLPEWYSQVITKAELIDYYDISGCYILRPWSYSIWDAIRNFLSTNIKKLGVKDVYFPIFVSKAALEREKTHIADFAPEVAWVTHSGSSELAEHIAVRPTSETVMYPAYAKWIQSHRDLPLRLNQWNNVVRWEFKQPQPFLRTREFLWQEGHTAFRTAEEADEEVLQILDLYRQVYEDLLAIPVVRGRKTEKEKFAGSAYTTTVEAYVPASGRGIQGATSHHLGQNFSKMFEIIYDDPDTQEKKYVYQNSWGLTTRTIGVMVLVHGDNRGLVLPPRVAEIQAIVVPCGITASSTPEERSSLMASCKALVDELVAAGIRSEADFRDNYSPGWKFNHWELKGVPIRVELGPKDISRGEIVAVRRLTGEKITMKRDAAGKLLSELLERTHKEMFDKATKERDERVSHVTKWPEFTAALDRRHLLLAPFCGEPSCEENIKTDSARVHDDPLAEIKGPSMGAKTLCIPFDQPRELTNQDMCIHDRCYLRAKYITLFGRSY